MKKLLTHLVALTLGMGVGFLVAQKAADKKYAELAQAEIDDVKETYDRLREEFFQKNANTPDPSHDVEPEGPPKKGKAKASANLIRTNPYEDAKRNYNVIPKEELEESEEPVLAEPIEEIDRTKPYLINDIEFDEEFDHHDKISLYYYKKDGILSEEAEDIVDDVEGMVGVENLMALDKQSSIWVRNEVITTDFEIVGINKSYAEAVHGIVEESPKERHKRASIKKAKKNEQ